MGQLSFVTFIKKQHAQGLVFGYVPGGSGSVQLRFLQGTVQAVPVWVRMVPLENGSLSISVKLKKAGPVPVSAPGNRFRQFRFGFHVLEVSQW